MPIWTVIHRDGLLEHVDADRIEDDGTGWSFMGDGNDALATAAK